MKNIAMRLGNNFLLFLILTEYYTNIVGGGWGALMI